MLKEVPVLIPGRYVLQGYDGKPRVCTFRDRDIDNAVTQGNKQIAAKLRVPACWMHDPDAYPTYLSHKSPDYLHQRQLAEGFIGEAKRYFKKDGKAYAAVDIPDPKDAAQFEKVGTVSPSLIWDWIDEKGVKWPGVTILHIGSTPKPVQRHLPRVSAYPTASLSHAAGAAWFSITIPTGSQSMADEMEDFADGEDTGEKAMISKLVDLLKKDGLNLSGDIADLATFAVALESAINTKHGESEPDGDEDLDDMGGEEVATATEAVGMPAMMSWMPKAVEAEAKTLSQRCEAIADATGWEVQEGWWRCVQVISTGFP
jgi:hypothetical protein